MEVSKVNIDSYRLWPSSWVSKEMVGERKDDILCSIMYRKGTVEGKMSIDGKSSWLHARNLVVKLWPSKKRNRIYDKRLPGVEAL